MWVDKIGKKNAKFTTLEKKHIDHIDLFGYIFAYTIFQFFVSPEFNNHRPNIAIAELASFRASVSCVLFRAGCKFSFAYSVQVLV